LDSTDASAQGFSGAAGQGFDGGLGQGLGGAAGEGFDAAPGPGLDGGAGQGFDGATDPFNNRACYDRNSLASYLASYAPLPDEVGEACQVEGSGVWCPEAAWLTQASSCYSFREGPRAGQDGTCCYAVYCNCCGRPFLVAGVARVAVVTERDDWNTRTGLSSSNCVTLDKGLRTALAQAWLDDALLEHASIASFARFILELLALGAPADLVAQAQRASLDEVSHARACFGLASRHAGRTLGPGVLGISGALRDPSLAAVAASVVVEGCVGETLSAIVAAEQLAVVEDAEARDALERIAADEARHAELAWCFVRWALARGGREVRRAVQGAFERALALASCAPRDCLCNGNLRDWHAHGRLSAAEQRSVESAGLRQVVVPCARALLRSEGYGAEAELRI
jgi:hypothetical protein